MSSLKKTHIERFWKPLTKYMRSLWYFGIAGKSSESSLTYHTSRDRWYHPYIANHIHNISIIYIYINILNYINIYILWSSMISTYIPRISTCTLPGLGSFQESQREVHNLRRDGKNSTVVSLICGFNMFQW